ncbi:hypothetical protein NBRC10513v2_003582 [Rhodotorula toruloides]
MPFSSFRSPAVDLADFLRSLAVPRAFYSSSTPGTSSQQEHEWEILRARQGGTKRLDFFDHDLSGPDGAVAVLRAVEKSPGVTALALSQNHLGDDGMRELLVGLKRLRSRDIGAHLEELNLSDCRLSDVSLHLITLHLLQPSPHPPSLKSLYLNYNNISLGCQSTLTSLPEFLGTTLSSPSCTLRCLALTSNKSIGTSGLVNLLSHLRLAAGPSQLSELRLSVTGLSPEAAEPLTQWLEDPEGGARLQILALNACGLGEAGVRRIARSVISGKACNLLHLECLANEEGDDERWQSVNEELLAQEEGQDWSDWKERLEEAKRRNQQAYRETRLAALRLVGPARILFGGNAVEDEGGDERSFPFLRLPIELQVHVLRCLMLLHPSSVAHLYPSTRSDAAPSSSTKSDNRLSAPLTESQFLRLIAYSASRPTLTTSRRIALAHSSGSAPSLNGPSGTGSWKKQAEDRDAGDGWEEFFLRQTGCDRFERASPL